MINELNGKVRIFETPETSTTELATVLGRLNETGEIVELPALDIVNTVQDLPQDFIVSCSGTGTEGSRIKYITDTIRELYLEPTIVPSMYGNASSVFINGNKIYLQYYEQDTVDPTVKKAGWIYLDARIVDNELVILETRSGIIPIEELSFTLSQTLHAECEDESFMYYATRTQAGSMTTFVKVSKANFGVYSIEQPFDGGGLHNIEYYDGYIYYVFSDTTGSVGHVGRIDSNLRNPEVVFDINTDPTRTVLHERPFLVYLDEIYLPTINTTSSATQYGKFVLQVYSMTGEMKRESEVIDLDPSASSGKVTFHWFSAYNGKLIMHTASSASIVKTILRMDCGYGVTAGDGYVQPTLEEFILSPARNLADDNTITRGGVVYMNSETSSSYPLERRLFVIDDYRDLAAMYEYNGDNYFSGGTPPTYVPKSLLKTKLSEFEDDISAGAQDLQSVTDNGAVTTNGITVNNAITADEIFLGSGETTAGFNVGANLNVSGDIVSLNGGDSGSIKSDNITASRNYQLPDESGTLAIATEYGGSYAQSPTWTGTAPTGTVESTWRATKIGKKVSVAINLLNATPGVTNTQVRIPLPTGLPTPAAIIGFTGASDYIAFSDGFMFSTPDAGPGAVSRGGLRKDGAGGYEVLMIQTGGSYRGAIVTFEYWTD